MAIHFVDYLQMPKNKSGEQKLRNKKLLEQKMERFGDTE